MLAESTTLAALVPLLVALLRRGGLTDAAQLVERFGVDAVRGLLAVLEALRRGDDPQKLLEVERIDLDKLDREWLAQPPAPTPAPWPSDEQPTVPTGSRGER